VYIRKSKSIITRVFKATKFKTAEELTRVGSMRSTGFGLMSHQ